MNEWIARINYNTICSIATLVLICSLYMILTESADHNANIRFAEKAEELQIKGKSKQYVLSQFGTPDYHKDDTSHEVLVYLPGPKWVLLRSEAKIGINRTTGLVDGWAVNTD